MVDEREDRYEGEEGEYHFSDDQINYDEVEAPKAAVAAVSMKKSIVDKLSGLSPSRRMLLAGVVFLSLIGLVYKMLLPSSPSLTGEISQIIPAKTMSQPMVAAKPATPPSLPDTTAAVQQPSPPAINAAAAQQTPISAPQIGMIQPGLPAQPIETAQTIPTATYPVTQAPTSVGSLPATVVPATPPVQAAQNVADRVKAVEDHNAAMMNLLQTEYAQKMSDLDMQSSLVRGKMDEMAKRVNRMEASLNQMTQLLQQNAPAASKSQAMSMENAPGMPSGRASVPKVAYTVQAIIPGRAWLKADTGDTVTVAEGDTLRDYGRISKIDPYDGVVEIDTGNKIIALSYGMNAE